MAAAQRVLTKQEAEELREQLIASLRTMGLISANERSVPHRYGSIDTSVDFANVTGYRHGWVPETMKNWGVVLTTGEDKRSTPRRKKAIHRDLPSMLDRVAKTVNARSKILLESDEYKMARAQKDFDRGWCAYRHDITCKLINGRFHALVKVGANDVWQDDVEYAVSHDTLVFKSKIGKVDRWVTIETLQKLLDHGVLLNPADVRLASDGG